MVRIGASKDGKTSVVKIDSHSHIYPDFYKEAVIAAGWNPGPDGMPYHPVSFNFLTLFRTDKS
jgi:hypothetical protein